MAGVSGLAPAPRWGDGLLPVVVQDVADGTVLMLAWANEAALDATLTTGEAHFWSRSRQALWRKGATSGNVQRVVSVHSDCDGDALLYRVHPEGPACHTGGRSCFSEDPGTFSLSRLEAIVAERAGTGRPSSYTSALLEGGPARPATKVVEEAGEVAVAAVADDEEAVARESADLLYHLLVLLRSRQVSLDRVIGVLAERHRERDGDGGG